MKRAFVILGLFAAVLCESVFCTAAQSATNVASDTILVRRADLPPNVLRQIEDSQQLATMAQRIETYGKWAGVGREVGLAVNDSLSAITTQADNFAKTGVGKFTMFLVAYKVLGKDLVGATVGVPLLVVWTTIFVVLWRRLYCVRTILDRIVEKTKFYKVVEPTVTGFDRTIAGAILFIAYAIATVWTIAGMIVR